MPYRRRRRRRRRTRRRTRIYRRRRRTNRFSGKNIIRRMPTALPDMIKTRMRYSFTLAVIGGGTYVFRGNSIYDPNLTGTGHQPAYHDFYEQQYLSYYVSGSSVKYRFTQLLTGDALQITCVPSLVDPGASFTTSFTHQRELPRSKTRIISGNANGATIRHRSSTKKMWGFGYDRSSVSSDVGSDPTAQWYWIVHWQSFSGATINGHVDVDLVYDVIWYNKKSLPPQD